jgi:hypothetical protein
MVRFMIVLAATACLYVGGMGRIAQAAETPRTSDLAFEKAHETAVAANPAGLVFQIHVKDNRTVFHMGERIPLILSIANNSALSYEVLPHDFGRTLGKSDHFATDRPEGVIDPEAVTEPWHHLNMISGNFGIEKLEKATQSFEIPLNEYLAFERPGTYQVYDTTDRVWSGTIEHRPGENSHVVPLVSNVVTVTIIPHDPAWEKQTFQQALAHYRGKHGSNVDLQTLKYLRTWDAAVALLRLVEAAPAHFNGPSPDFVASPVDTPYRQKLREQVIQDIQDPDIGITEHTLDVYAMLTYCEKHSGDTAALAPYARGLSYYSDAFDMLASVVQKKRGAAWARSLATLAIGALPAQLNGYQQELMECFDLLPVDEQYFLLRDDFPYAFDSAIVPALARMVATPANDVNPDVTQHSEELAVDSQWQSDELDWRRHQVTDLAMQRLIELDPVRAQSIALAQICRKWPTVDPGPLMRMPGPPVDLDADLLANIRDAFLGKADLCTHACLVGRFGSAAIRLPIEALYLAHKQELVGFLLYADNRLHSNRLILPALMAYFGRVDPSFAQAQITELGDTLVECDAVMASIDFSPVVEKKALSDLRDGDPSLIYDPINAFVLYGRPEHKAALLSRLRSGDADSDGVNRWLTRYLPVGRSWVLSAEDLALIAKSNQRDGNASAATGDHLVELIPKIDADFDTLGWFNGYWHVDDCALDTKTGLLKKLALYPQGTRFVMKIDRMPWQKQTFAELSAFLKAHGMSLEEKHGW